VIHVCNIFSQLSGQLSGIVLGYGLDDQRFKSWQRVGIFLFTTVSKPALGPTQPPIQWVPGALSLVVKRPGRETDHSPPSSDDIKNAWSYTSTPQYAFMAWYSVKAQGQLYLFLICHWRPNYLTVQVHFNSLLSGTSTQQLCELVR
jgi:hypothetical protein